ncbi:hypothetical protein BD410DRAFT_313750 [Rickenella mellea]|uniref:DUF6534 domain-containing protein n=1 Tax=Rickenella mellea TaxID=50990 RepID=A0A4Y7Q034_9AGAM|nr:hypothetical protein BD410DRAFT_313750 [Rickenella mellea]
MAPSLNSTFGAGMIGLFASATLYGVTLLQTFRYFRRYPDDRVSLKWLISALCFADTAHLVLCTWSFHWYLVVNFGNVENLSIPHWTMNLQATVNGFIGVSFLLFNARRVYHMSSKICLAASIFTLAMVHGTLCIYFSVESFVLDDFMEYSKLTWVICVGLGSSAAANILAALSLCYCLKKSRTSFLCSNALITRLMLYTINSGILTSITATISLATFAAMPTNFIWLSFFWILGRFYVNSLLAM